MNSNEPIKEVVDYIDNHLEEYLSVGNLSKAANYSVPQLFRLFVSDMNMTPIKYVLRRKLYYAAKELVSNDRKIIDIANRFGFESHDSFCRAFKRVYGATPSAFRKKAQALNHFYRDNVYCISGYSVPLSLIIQEKDVDAMSEKCKSYEEFYKIYGTDVEIVTVPATKLIGIERPVGGGAHEAFYECYDKVFRNAPNRKYPHSENVTHGLPRLSLDGKTFYFVGIEVGNFDHVPDGAVKVEMPEQLCAVIGFEGGIDYDTIDYYFSKWINYGQNKYNLDTQKIDHRFLEENAWKTYSPIWEYYSPNKDCEVYEERIYLPVKHK